MDSFQLLARRWGRKNRKIKREKMHLSQLCWIFLSHCRTCCKKSSLLQLHSNPYVQKVIPKKVPALGVPLIFGAVGFILGHVIFVQGFTDKRMNELKSNTTLPLWRDKKNVVNLNRVFFHLDESKNNSPDLLYHGL